MKDGKRRKEIEDIQEKGTKAQIDGGRETI